MQHYTDKLCYPRFCVGLTRVRICRGALWLFLLLLPVLSACGTANTNGNNSGTVDFVMDVERVGQKLYEELEYRDQLEELNPTVVYAILGVEEKDVEAQKNYFSSGATAEEIVVFQAKNEESLETLRAALEARIEDQINIYASYAPEEVSFLKEAVLEEKGTYLIYCVAADPGAAKALVNEAFTGK